MAATKPKKVTKTNLVGQFFHSINERGNIEWQGWIIGNPEPGWYLCQLYEWMVGLPNIQRLVKIDEMSKWLFYDSSEQMIDSYENGAARDGGPYRKNS